MYSDNDFRLYHHGILGQKWGVRNGDHYPLRPSDHSASEQKAGWRQSLASSIRRRRIHAKLEHITKKSQDRLAKALKSNKNPTPEEYKKLKDQVKSNMSAVKLETLKLLALTRMKETNKVGEFERNELERRRKVALDKTVKYFEKKNSKYLDKMHVDFNNKNEVKHALQKYDWFRKKFEKALGSVPEESISYGKMYLYGAMYASYADHAVRDLLGKHVTSSQLQIRTNKLVSDIVMDYLAEEERKGSI